MSVRRHDVRLILLSGKPVSPILNVRQSNPCCETHQTPSSSRFIPTCVGNISFQIILKFRCAVHPHVCGEHLIDADSSGESVGSSPRVWGTYYRRANERDDYRFIPTCVGNISRMTYLTGISAVHPHVCGEHFPLS